MDCQSGLGGDTGSVPTPPMMKNKESVSSVQRFTDLCGLPCKPSRLESATPSKQRLSEPGASHLTVQASSVSDTVPGTEAANIEPVAPAVHGAGCTGLEPAAPAAHASSPRGQAKQVAATSPNHGTL
jgi:hypothetical protein